MATKAQKKAIRYFYLSGDLHKVLRVVRATDYVEAWNYPQGKRVGYVWSDVRKRMEKAFTLKEASSIIQRHRVQVEKYILAGAVKPPQKIYALDGTMRPGRYMLSESDILDLHAYLLTVHRGRPRKDGQITPGEMPTRQEIKAIMREEVETYVKTADGRFVRAYRENDW
jgi:hypothetical protein